MLIISIIQSFRGRYISGFLSPHVERKRAEADHSMCQPKKIIEKRKMAFGLCCPVLKVAGRHFKKLIPCINFFKISELKCLSTITFYDGFFPALFSPRFSNVMFIAHLLLLFVLAWFTPQVIQ